MSEQDLVNAIIQYIETIGGVAVRINSGVTFVKGQDGTKTYAIRGAKKGTSDILACLGGKFFAIEAKDGERKGTKATPDQLEFIDRVIAAGGIGFVTWDIDDVIRRLDTHFMVVACSECTQENNKKA